MTPEERLLWFRFLKKLPIGFRRQKVIGEYIADFYCPDAQIVIELDGSQHYSEPGLAKDSKRDLFFSSKGIRVLHFSNAEIWKRFDTVCDIIRTVIDSRTCKEQVPVDAPSSDGLQPTAAND